jgi:xanthine/uracil permease
MNNFLIIGFLVVLIGLTLLAVRMWYTRRGADVSEAERRVFARFMLGLGVLWLVAVVAYFAGPLFSTIK